MLKPCTLELNMTTKMKGHEKVRKNDIRIEMSKIDFEIKFRHIDFLMILNVNYQKKIQQ